MDDILEEVAEQFRKLPGIGVKSANLVILVILEY